MEKSNKYKQIQYEERIIIDKLLKVNKSLREIAKILNRSVSSISDEINRNKVNNIYDKDKAEFKSYQRRWRAKEQCLKLGINTDLAKIVEDKLELKWSPDSISGYLKKELNIFCSGKAIYKYIKSRCLESKLMFKGKPRKLKWKYIKAKVDKDKRNIKERLLTQEIGHYEMDFIVSKFNKYSLLVVTDIFSKYTEIRLLTDRKQITILNTLKDIFKNKKTLSITTDNDIAFSNWKLLEKVLNTKIYFTDPYSSWQKGLVENTNKWIRCFIPKKTDLFIVSNNILKEIHDYLNNRPRKIINYFTASELYFGKKECSE